MEHLSILAHSRLDDDKMEEYFFLSLGYKEDLVLLKLSGVGGEGVICVLIDRSIECCCWSSMDAKNIRCP